MVYQDNIHELRWQVSCLGTGPHETLPNAAIESPACMPAHLQVHELLALCGTLCRVRHMESVCQIHLEGQKCLVPSDFVRRLPMESFDTASTGTSIVIFDISSGGAGIEGN